VTYSPPKENLLQTFDGPQLIGHLNPLLRGWASSHGHVVSKVTLAKIDHGIFHTLWRWTKRRHPHKARRWIRQRYFTTVGNTQWGFPGISPGSGTPTNTTWFNWRQRRVAGMSK
jgi:Group II intron, maturase-specific domain